MTQYLVAERHFGITGMGDTLDQDKFVESALFTGWAASLGPGIRVESVEIVSVDNKPNGDPIFAKLNVKAYNSYGQEIWPKVVFLRGGSVAMLMILVDEKRHKHAILIEQIRLPVGEEALVEIPAGMLDGDSNFAGVAAKEIQEEIGLTITADDLIPLTPPGSAGSLPLRFPKAIAVSPGACDETMRFFLFLKDMLSADIEALRGKLTGNREEGESIRLRIVPLDLAPHMTRDGKFFTAWALAKLQGAI